MEFIWKCVVTVILVASTVRTERISDELYFRAPLLYHLDDYEKCLYDDGFYCLGEFELAAEGPSRLYDELVKMSSDRNRLNRSLVHRGVCVSWCEEKVEDPAISFQQCVNRTIQSQYGLQTNLRRLHYCKSKAEPGVRPVDYTDILVVDVVLLIIILNVTGTVYDFYRNPDVKPSRFLLAWSLRVNWHRLTAYHSGEQRLDTLASIHGIKAHQVYFVVMAHCHLAMSVVYQKDPRKTDEMVSGLDAILLKNTTINVQSFVTLTSFLLAYMLLLHAEKTKKTLTLKHAPAIVINRYLRMTPTVMFVVAVTATWVARAGDGPLWTLVQELEVDCRRKWWTHLFHVNNLIDKDQRCLIQSWFLAVDMQVFPVAVALTLLLLPRPRRAPCVLLSLYACAVLANLALNVRWQMVPMMHLITAENLRHLLVGLESYNWMFSMPWTSLPATINGLLLAFLHYNLQKEGFDATKHKWIRIASYCWFLAGLSWMFTSALVHDVTNPLLLSIYATLDKNVFNCIVTFGLWMVFNKVNNQLERYLSWRGFRSAGRLALCALLVHWHANLPALATHTQPLEASVFKLFTSAISDLVMTFLLAVPLHLMVELPSQTLVGMLM